MSTGRAVGLRYPARLLPVQEECDAKSDAAAGVTDLKQKERAGQNPGTLTISIWHHLSVPAGKIILLLCYLSAPNGALSINLEPHLKHVRLN